MAALIRNVLLAWLVVGMFASAWALEVMAPQDGVAVGGDSVVVIGSGAGSGRVQWRVEGDLGVQSGDFQPHRSGKFALAIPLMPGLNNIRVGDSGLVVFSASEGHEPLSGFPLLRVHAGDITDCNNCHKTGYELRAGGYPGVCLTCHVVEAQNPAFKGDASSDRHFLSSGSKCGKCHAPHGSVRAKLLLGSSQELCGSCHGTWNGGGEDVHPAYEEGGCAACHDPHFSGYDKQLKRPIRPLCQECHEQGGEASAHEPVADETSCGNCHDVHGDSGSMTPVAVPELCSECHDHVLTAGHGSDLEECAGCHSVHGDGGMLLGGVSETCAECHDDISEQGIQHAALENRCQRCHSPHSDDAVAVAWQACTECHDLRGNRELASLHGNLDLPSGTCSTCHQFHGEARPDLLAGDLHFPLTQGKCGACHKPGAQGDSLGPVDAASCRMCHPFEKQLEAVGARLHDPVAEGDCSLCHEPHLKRRSALLRADQVSLCGECHDAAEVGAGQQAHTAMESCTDCHHAHGSINDHLLLAESETDLCLECHDDPAGGAEEVHAALDEGCGVCHSPHSGYGPGNILARERELCGECHDAAEVGAGQQAHTALDTCTDCHRAHGGDNDHLLSAQTASDQCLECHDDPAEGEGEVHAALDEGCLQCHSPHSGYAPGNLNAPEREVCLECHDDPTDSEAHAGNAARTSCSNCHDPHHSENASLLRTTRSAARTGRMAENTVQ